MPRAGLVGLFMLAVVLIARPRSVQVNVIETSIDASEVAEFFGEIGAERCRITTRGLVPGTREQIVTEWIERELRRSRGNSSPQERIWHSSLSLALCRKRLDDPSGHTIQRHQFDCRRPPLDPGKTYIELKYEPDGIACPEFHGVIDPEEPALLSFWGEGG